jgi:hypothetical protein
LFVRLMIAPVSSEKMRERAFVARDPRSVECQQTIE